MPGCTTSTYLNQSLSWEVGTSPAELEGNNTGLVDPKYCAGVQNRLPVQPTSDVYSTPLSILSRTASTDHGDHRAAAERGYIEEVSTSLGYHSNLFLVPKKDGRQRSVINLKFLNEFVRKEHFKMEGIHNLKDLLQPGNWLAKVDLKDAFFTIPMHNQCRKYLRFTFQGKTYHFLCLPFGQCSAPWVFTKPSNQL